jgi:hypothetical protein
MIARRHLILAGMLTLFAAPRAVFADPAAQAFLEKIFAAYKGKNSKGVRIDSDARLRLYFEPKLAAIINKNERDAARHGDIGDLDGDPFINAQDWEITKVDISVSDTAPDRATATVKFDNFKMPSTVIYDLVRLKDGWRIADITWPDNDPANRTLRGLFVKK